MESSGDHTLNRETASDSSSGFGEIEVAAPLEQIEGNEKSCHHEDVTKVKEPITILSVEVMPSGSADIREICSNTSTDNVNQHEVLNDNGIIDFNQYVMEKDTETQTTNIHTDMKDIADETSMPQEAISDHLNDPNDSITSDPRQNASNQTQFGKETIADDNVHLTSQKFCLETSTNTLSTTGLSLLAQYGSDNDSESESVVEVPLPANQDYRNKIVEIDSDSDSDSSTSSDSDVEYLNVLRQKIDKRLMADVEDDDEEDEEGDNENGKDRRKPKPKVRAKGELLIEDLPPIHDLQITVTEDECIELGKIHSIVDQLVLVSTLPNSMLLDLETVLFLEKGQKVLGEVFDVLGQVADPLYCVRFNSNSQINEKNIQIGDVVYVAPKKQYTQFIILSSLMSMKGSDASWENDIEPPPRYLDYSDDEQEQLARRQLRNKNRPTEHEDAEKRPRKDNDEGPQTSSNRSPQVGQYRNRQSFTRGSEESNQNHNSYGRPRTPQHQYRAPSRMQPNQYNNHPNSWHSNYYPQNYPMPAANYGYQAYPPMPVQGYPQVPPMYPMVPYPQTHHAIRPPPNNASVPPPQMVPGVFNMRPPTMVHFDSSAPPPGSQ
ncbi:H/ACA ribonucleoprotein complex non-core subunit NAF1 isoform X1 [Stomoxys calcitrans]|uniref:H/ACA ribonucleoprotein complex non-core subunit NAF1 isoform X1 n=1 Tax=Stomoxys calcitrans TaxID=35570 RepID=UPI0027E306B0|nr:H/ACA ribonucleoprotein complex non-core subunit NAF1 isoform X1 [Stomoxys calcitrans]